MSTLPSVQTYADLLEQVENHQLNEGRPAPKKYNSIPDMVSFRVPEIENLSQEGIDAIVSVGNKLLPGQDYTLFEIYELEGANGQPPEWAPGDNKAHQMQKFHQSIKRAEQAGLREVRKIVSKYSTMESTNIEYEFDLLEAEYGFEGAFDILHESNPTLARDFRQIKLFENEIQNAIIDARAVKKVGGRRLQVFKVLYESYGADIATDIVDMSFDLNESVSNTDAAKTLAKKYKNLADKCVSADSNYDNCKQHFTGDSKTKSIENKGSIKGEQFSNRRWKTGPYVAK